MSYICDVCGRDRWSEEKPCPRCEPLSECEVEEKPRATTRVQEYPGLDAGGFLLVALGHLMKAIERLGEMPKSAGVYRAKRETQMAANMVRYALENLKMMEEETCEKSLTDSERP